MSGMNLRTIWKSQMRAAPNIGRVPACTQPHNHRSAASVSAQNTPLLRGRCISELVPHLSSLCTHHTPPLLSLKTRQQSKTKSVITLDLWLNRLWQHWKVVNEIAFCICISVLANKSNPEHACWAASPHGCRAEEKPKLPCSNSVF